MKRFALTETTCSSTRIFALAAAMPALFCLTGVASGQNAGKAAADHEYMVPARLPNIVFILADDLGYGDLKCLNPEGKIATPNLDRLATEGRIFSDAHSSSSLCSPSRYSILTGRYCWRTRLRSSVLRPYDPPLIAPDRLTVPKLLRQHGYQSACIGKWHLGWDWPRRDKKVDFLSKPIANGPTTRGFDYYFGTDVPNYPPYCFLENDRTVGVPSTPLPEALLGNNLASVPGPAVPGWDLQEILPAMVSKGVQYLGERATDKRPFFLYLPLTSPHEPVVPTPRFQGKSGISDVGDFIMETDWAVGELLRELEKNGLAGNTLVIFTADNGHCPYTGLEAFLRHGHHPSGPYRGYKSDIWDGGHREPFLARWPGKVKPGTTCDDTICLSDLLATCAEIVGARLPDNAGEDSVSILPDLLGTAAGPLREAVVHQSGQGRLAIRQGRWKLEFCPGSGGYGNWAKPGDADARKLGLPEIQLYDLGRDIGERRNVQAAHPEVVARLTKLLQRYIENGRSTPGPPQKNDVVVPIVPGGQKNTSSAEMRHLG